MVKNQLKLGNFEGGESTKYKIEKGKLVHRNPFCPWCGEGVSMADRGEWWSCGKCGTRWAKEQFGKNCPEE